MSMYMSGCKKGEDNIWRQIPLEKFGIIGQYMDEIDGLCFFNQLRELVLMAGDEFDYRETCSITLSSEMQQKLFDMTFEKYIKIPKGYESKKWCNLLLKFLKVCMDNDCTVFIS